MFKSVLVAAAIIIASPAIEEHEDPGIDNLLEGVEVPEVLPDPE